MCTSDFMITFSHIILICEDFRNIIFQVGSDEMVAAVSDWRRNHLLKENAVEKSKKKVLLEIFLSNRISLP